MSFEWGAKGKGLAYRRGLFGGQDRARTYGLHHVKMAL